MPPADSARQFAPLDLEEVRAFLLAYPAFIREDAELMHAIAAKGPTGNVVDIGEIARDRLARRASQLEHRAHWMIETARDNEATLARTHAAVLSILDCTTPEQLAEKLDHEIAPMLGADAAVIVLSDTFASGEALCVTGARIERLVAPRDGVRIGPVDGDRSWLFGRMGADIRSEAVARLELGDEERLGAFALGSTGADTFRADDSPELFLFLSRVVERIVGRWLSEGAV
jgi:uncharacterized protein